MAYRDNIVVPGGRSCRWFPTNRTTAEWLLCAACSQFKKAEEFRIEPKMRRGRNSWCRQCMVRRTQRWRAEQGDELLARRRKQREANLEAERRRDMIRYRNRKPLRPKQCLNCGTTFVPEQRNQQLHCAPDCTARRHRGKRAGIPKRLRLKILKRDEYRCYLQPWTGCDGTIPEWLPWHHPLGPTVDHVIPESAGGKATPDNLRAAHWACNRWKAARLLEAA